MKIKTEYVAPVARWTAIDDETYDGMPGSPIGIGRTEQEAIDELNEWIERIEKETETA